MGNLEERLRAQKAATTRALNRAKKAEEHAKKAEEHAKEAEEHAKEADRRTLIAYIVATLALLWAISPRLAVTALVIVAVMSTFLLLKDSDTISWRKMGQYVILLLLVLISIWAMAGGLVQVGFGPLVRGGHVGLIVGMWVLLIYLLRKEEKNG